MPSHHIWIRKEDEAKWQAIADKPEWLHEHLQTKADRFPTEFQRAASTYDEESGKHYFQGQEVIMLDPTYTDAEDAV